MTSPIWIMISLRCTEHPPMYSRCPPQASWCLGNVLNISQCTEHPPMYLGYPPHASWYSPDVLMISPWCIHGSPPPPMYSWTINYRVLHFVLPIKLFRIQLFSGQSKVTYSDVLNISWHSPYESRYPSVVLSIPRCTHGIPHKHHDVPPMYWIFPNVLNIPQCTYDIPHMHHDIPPMYSWYPRDVFMAPLPLMYSWFPPRCIHAYRCIYFFSRKFR